MKLDGTVCRGSLIIHKGETYVVIGPLGHRVPMPGSVNWIYKPGWLIIPTENAEAGLVAYRQTISKDEDVEMFFPGNVFPLSEFII